MTVQFKSGEEDPHARAQSFCSTHNIEDSSCARRLGEAFHKHILKHDPRTTQRRSSSSSSSIGTVLSHNNRHSETLDIHLSDSSPGKTMGPTKGTGTSSGERLPAAKTSVNIEEDNDAPQIREHLVGKSSADVGSIRSDGRENVSTVASKSSVEKPSAGNIFERFVGGDGEKSGKFLSDSDIRPVVRKRSSPVNINDNEDGAATTKVPSNSRGYQQGATVHPTSITDQQVTNPSTIPASQHRPTVYSSSRGNGLPTYGAESLVSPTNQRQQQHASPAAAASERHQVRDTHRTCTCIRCRPNTLCTILAGFKSTYSVVHIGVGRSLTSSCSHRT